jgi:hypothetical protein
VLYLREIKKPRAEAFLRDCDDFPNTRTVQANPSVQSESFELINLRYYQVSAISDIEMARTWANWSRGFAKR